MSERRHFWSNVGAVAYKEAAVLRHDKPFLGVVFVQPIMMFTLFAVAISNKPANVPWAVLDRSQTAVSRRFVEEIAATGYFLAPQRVLEQGEQIGAARISLDEAGDDDARGRSAGAHPPDK